MSVDVRPPTAAQLTSLAALGAWARAQGDAVRAVLALPVEDAVPHLELSVAQAGELDTVLREIGWGSVDAVLDVAFDRIVLPRHRKAIARAFGAWVVAEVARPPRAAPAAPPTPDLEPPPPEAPATTTALGDAPADAETPASSVATSSAEVATISHSPTPLPSLITLPSLMPLPSLPPPRPPLPSPAPPRPSPDQIERYVVPPPPTERDALRAWAHDVGAEHALAAAPPPYLGRSLYGPGPRIGEATMEDLVVAAATRDGRWASGVASTYLARAVQVARFIADREAWVATYGGPPTDPTIVALLARVRDRRSAFGHVEPPAAPVTTLCAQLLEAPLRVVVREREHWTDTTREVTLLLDQPDLPMRCSTCVPASSSCRAHQARALDALILRLHEPPSPGLATLAELLGAPAWSRFVRALDRRLAAVRPEEVEHSEDRLVWRVRLDDGEPSVELLLQHPKKTGGFGKGSRVYPYALPRSSAHLRNTFDGPPLRALRAKEPYATSTPPRGGSIELLLMLVGHPRVVLAQDREDVPIAIEIARLSLRLEDDDGRGLAARFRVGSAPIAAAEIARVHEDDSGERHVLAVAPEGARLFIAPVDDVAQAVGAALATHTAPFPPASHDEIVRRLADHAESFDLDLPPELDGGEVPASASPMVRVTPLEGAALDVEICARPIPGGPAWAPGEGPTIARHVDAGRRTFARRDLDAEQRAAEALIPTLPLHDADAAGPFRYRILSEDRALDLVLALRDREGELAVEWAADSPLRVERLPTRLRIEVTEKRDWFGLEGSVEVDGAVVTLATLLGAVRAGRRYVAIAPGRFAAIEQELRERLEAVEGVVFDGKHGLEVSPLAADKLEALVESSADLAAAASFRSLVSRIDAAKALDPALPDGLTATLRHYQVEGFAWLARLAAWGAGACLADDMGLGKTLQALALLLHRAADGPALVVAPTSVGSNWLREAARFAPGLRVAVYRGPDRVALLDQLGPGDVLVSSYGIVTLDAEPLARVRFATLVIDEAQAIKNALTRRARAVRSLQADMRVALTGTPVENHLGELWSLMRILTPGLLGSWEQFRDRFAGPIERTRSPARMAALARVLRPFVLRRTKAEVAPELPPRTEITRLVEPSPKERELYQAARLAAVEAIARPDGEDARFLVLAWLTKLRRLACHPRLFDEHSAVPSSKLAALLELVEELGEGGHRALVFSQFTSHLALVREALDARRIRYEYLDGSTPYDERARRVDAFQEGSARLFLISLKAGGTGLNLTGADYVLHLDPWWNPAVEDQATDRAHRIGQTRAVTVVRLVMRGTVEEQVIELHADKRALASAVFDEEHGAPGKLSTDELATLLREGALATDGDDGNDEGAEVVASDGARRP